MSVKPRRLYGASVEIVGDGEGVCVRSGLKYAEIGQRGRGVLSLIGERWRMSELLEVMCICVCYVTTNH